MRAPTPKDIGKRVKYVSGGIGFDVCQGKEGKLVGVHIPHDAYDWEPPLIRYFVYWDFGETIQHEARYLEILPE